MTTQRGSPRPYRPSNGSEGMDFQEQYCFRCAKDNYPDGPMCPIVADSYVYKIDDPEYPKAWIIGDDGFPTCTEFEARPQP